MASNPAYEKLFDALRKLNVDVDGTIERFVGNDDLFVSFAVKFSESDRMPAIYSSYEARNTDDLIMNIHKMKGVAGNLGMTDIFKVTESAVNKLRAGSYDGIYEDILLIEKLYNAVCAAVKENAP